ncbi:MAG: hypothetical protein EXR79_07945 [Myxococcales bacterium]|nr:hypothetical protein [Myxococcales bacterium]
MAPSATSLTFFSELDAPAFVALTARPEVRHALQASGSGVAVALVDLSADRAAALRCLEEAGIAWTAWLVLDIADGYWLGADNADLAAQRWRDVQVWAAREGLRVQAVGLDIEPPHRDAVALYATPGRTLWRLVRGRRAAADLDAAQRTYAELVQAIRATGARVETYQLPLLHDERAARSRLAQRSLGLVDVQADREVVMLYRSALAPPFGDWLIDAYGPGCEAIALGITGGGVASLDPWLGARRLDGPALTREVLRARQHTPHLYVFSLEGCVAHGTFAAACAAAVAPMPSATPASSWARLGRRVVQVALAAEPVRHRVRQALARTRGAP